jgi:CRP-like cAMP-binding protein/uncharacterized protein (DUF2062 family)
MSQPKLTIARPDSKTLLTVAVLSLSNDLRLSAAHPGRMIVKYQPGRRYLTLNPLQWTVLKAFEGGRTVPAALKHLVHERGCIPLHEYYELILQALDAGVLQTPGYPVPPAITPAPWKIAVPPTALRVIGGGVVAVALVLILINPITPPNHPAWWVLGWLLLGVSASAGAFLSACVVSDAAADVYRPRFKLRTPLPRFSVDVDDALLAGPDGAINLAIARVAPAAALCALAAAAAPSLSLPLFCGLLVSLAPLPGQPALRMLRALHHSPQLTTSHGRLFAPNRRVLRRLRLLASRENFRFAGVLAGYVIPWLILVAFTWMATTAQDPSTLLRYFREAEFPRLARHALIGAETFAAITALIACVIGVIALRQKIARRRVNNAQDVASRIPRAQTLPHASDVVEFLARTHPFQLVPIARRDAAARSMQLLAFKPGDVLLARGDKRPRLLLLYSGEAQTLPPDGKPDSAMTFSAGSIFGEGTLLNGEPQPAEVRATEAGVALILEQSAYLALIAPHVPTHKLADAAQKVALLRRSALARRWPPHLLEGFARRAELLRFAHGEVILHEGQENLWFHLLLEGELHVMRKGRRLGRIHAGDFFGEISLLQNGFAAADIVGHRPGRYLSVPKNDFLIFFAHDPAVAMQFEAVASRRLGRPVFPL